MGVPVPPAGDARKLPPWDRRGRLVVVGEYVDERGAWLEEVWPSYDQDGFRSLEEADVFAIRAAKGCSRAPRPKGWFSTRAAEVWQFTTPDGKGTRRMGRVEIDEHGAAVWV